MSLAPGFTISGDNPYIVQISIVADDEAAGRVEHHHALGHIVQRQREQAAFAVTPR